MTKFNNVVAKQRAIDGVNYNNAMNTSKILDALAQSKIEQLQQQVSALQLQNSLAGVVRYPSATTYTAGVPPFAPNIAPFTPFA